MEINTIKIGICDDNQIAIDHLFSYLKQYELAHPVHFEIFCFSSGEQLIEHFIHDIQILFLDIQMGGINGIETARKLRSFNQQLFIFFVTSHISFALQGYDVHAYAFLQKPIEYPLFSKNLSDAIHQLTLKQQAVLKLKTKTSIDIIHCHDIIYLEVYIHNTSVILKDTRKQYTYSLSEIEKQIRNFGFFRVHKSFLINFKHVTMINNTSLQMSNGDIVPLSKHRKNEFIKAYFTYIGGNL